MLTWINLWKYNIFIYGLSAEESKIGLRWWGSCALRRGSRCYIWGESVEIAIWEWSGFELIQQA